MVEERLLATHWGRRSSGGTGKRRTPSAIRTILVFRKICHGHPFPQNYKCKGRPQFFLELITQVGIPLSHFQGGMT
jgi:hypothetical protein